MSFPSRLSSYSWVMALLAALGFLLWLTIARLHRVDYVTNLADLEATVTAASPTGYAGGVRQLIVPEHNNDSVQWIMQTQQMLGQGDWRVRRVSYDNAPLGRTVLSPSLYRWWLALVAAVDHGLSQRPLGLGVETAARLADPWLHALLLVSTVVFAARRFGQLAAGLLAIALVTIFPFGGAFLPGQPNDDGLGLFFGLWSVLLPLAGVLARKPLPSSAGEGATCSDPLARWFLAGGVTGGVALWIDVVRAIPILVGIALGGALASVGAYRASKAGRGDRGLALWPWRSWALGGAVTIFAGYLVEYSPAYLGTLQLRNIHPLYGLAWLGVGELLHGFSPNRPSRASRPLWRTLVLAFLALLAVAAVPAALAWVGIGDLFTADSSVARLANLTGSPAAENLWAWMRHDGFTLAMVATCLPAAVLAFVGWLLLRRGTDELSRAGLALGVGPVLVALAFACWQLHGWNTFDAVLLALLTATTAVLVRSFPSHVPRSAYAIGALLVLTPGAVILTDKALAGRHEVVTENDVVSLFERDLARWLARRGEPEGTVVLAPPNLTAALIYHGGLAGLGTPYWENKDGFVAAMRIAGASSPDEAQALARSRNLSYIIVPSWDNFLDEYSRLGANQVEHTLVNSLHRWLPPRWLSPVPYQLPKVDGFEAQSVAIFRVVDVQDNATALSRLAEYFVEMDMIPQAMGVADALERSFPADLGAAVARVLATKAAADGPAFARAQEDVKLLLSRGLDESLPWDRRVSLAIALAEGRQFDPAREQVRRCLADLDETLLRSLTTVSLHRLQTMSRRFGLEFGTAEQRALAQQLLPPELRDRS